MRYDARDLASGVIYFCAVGVLLGGVALGGAIALNIVPGINWVEPILGAAPVQKTRLSQALLDAQEIQAALAKPIPPPAPLPPITATVAIGHLRPGSSKVVPSHRLTPPGFDAMALGIPDRPRAVAPPDLHKVY